MWYASRETHAHPSPSLIGADGRRQSGVKMLSFSLMLTQESNTICNAKDVCVLWG